MSCSFPWNIWCERPLRKHSIVPSSPSLLSQHFSRQHCDHIHIPLNKSQPCLILHFKDGYVTLVNLKSLWPKKMWIIFTCPKIKPSIIVPMANRRTLRLKSKQLEVHWCIRENLGVYPLLPLTCTLVHCFNYLDQRTRTLKIRAEFKYWWKFNKYES